MEYKSSNDLSLHYYCESVNDPRASDVTTNDKVRVTLDIDFDEVLCGRKATWSRFPQSFQLRGGSWAAATFKWSAL